MNAFKEPREGARRSQQKAATARAAIVADRAELEEKGLEAAGVRAIDARAGVAAGTAIHLYCEKRDLRPDGRFEDREATLEGSLSRLDTVAKSDLDWGRVSLPMTKYVLFLFASRLHGFLRNLLTTPADHRCVPFLAALRIGDFLAR